MISLPVNVMSYTSKHVKDHIRLLGDRFLKMQKSMYKSYGLTEDILLLEEEVPSLCSGFTKIS